MRGVREEENEHGAPDCGPPAMAKPWLRVKMQGSRRD